MDVDDDKEKYSDMKKKHKYITVMGLTLTILTACEKTEAPAPEAPATYGINETSTDNNEQLNDEKTGYEIDDMLPRPSDDTRIMSVEEAEEFMKNKANTDTGEDKNAE